MSKQIEHDIQNEIRVHISEKHLATIFRANVGTGWTGNDVRKKMDGSNDTIIRNARRFDTGLPAGFPDLFGLKPIQITADMVGKKIAVFCFVEVKQRGKKPTKVQTHMHEFLAAQGAIGGIAHSPEEAVELLRGGKNAEQDTDTRI
jgi:hypothetical protein